LALTDRPQEFAARGPLKAPQYHIRQ
jgi:hypothetical protein